MATTTTTKSFKTLLTENLKSKIYYFNLHSNNFAIANNDLYFFDDKFKIDFGVNIKNSKNEAIKGLITNAINNSIIKKNNATVFSNTDPLGVTFDSLIEIKVDTEITYNSNPDKVIGIEYDLDEKKLLLELENEGLVDYEKSKIELYIPKVKKTPAFKPGDAVIYGTDNHTVYIIDSIAGKTVTMKGDPKKKMLLTKLTKYDPNKTKTTKPLILKPSTKPSPIKEGYVYGTISVESGARVIYKNGEPNKLYYIKDALGNDAFRITARNLSGDIIEDDIIVKKNEIENASKIKKGDIVVKNKKNISDDKKYYKVKSVNTSIANIINIHNKESRIEKNKLFKISNSKYNKQSPAIIKGYIYGTKKIQPGSRVIYKKGDPDKMYTIKTNIDKNTVKLISDNGINKEDIIAKISDIENARKIKKGDIVASEKAFFNKNEHYRVESVNDSTASVMTKNGKPKTLLLENLYKVSNSKNKNKKSTLSTISNMFSSKNGIKKNSKVVYKSRVYIVKETPSRLSFNPYYTLENNSKGTTIKVAKKDLENSIRNTSSKSNVTKRR